MKRSLLLLVALGLTAGLSASVTGKFYDHLTPEQRRAAGIGQLTEEQRAALNALADLWAEAQAEPAIVAAREKAVAEVREQTKAEKGKNLGFASTPTAADIIRTRIAGPFRGWEKWTVFRLENGQTWAVDGGGVEPRFFGLRENPEIEIRPAAFGTWKLYLLPDGLWVRVKRVQ
ncbi:MAG: hypothetical protein C0502_05810 [Opitutus sp.]|nr:hypothetical protein [Opitutus sp.]